MCDGDRGSGPVSVLPDNDVGFTCTGVVALDGIGTVQQDDHVGVLLQAVVHDDSVCDEVVGVVHGPVEHRLHPDRLHPDHRIPGHIVGDRQIDVDAMEDLGDLRQRATRPQLMRPVIRST